MPSAAVCRESRFSLLKTFIIVRLLYIRDIGYSVNTLLSVCVKLDPGHTYIKHLVLSLKPGVTSAEIGSGRWI